MDRVDWTAGQALCISTQLVQSGLLVPLDKSS
jgi:hypothetical protein